MNEHETSNTAQSVPGGRRVVLLQYLKFFINGSVLGVVSLGLQQLLYRALGGNDGWRYAVAAALSYMILVVVNFAIQRRFVFQTEGLFVKFVVANMSMMVLVALSSPLFLTVIDAVLGAPWGERTGFAAAALASSVPSFLIKRYWVFGHPWRNPFARA